MGRHQRESLVLTVKYLNSFSIGPKKYAEKVITGNEEPMNIIKLQRSR